MIYIRASHVSSRVSRVFGGAAMEYIIVSTAAALIAITATAFTVKTFQDQIAKMEDILTREADVDSMFGEFPH